LDFIARLSAVHRQEGFDLLVLDTLATLLPATPNYPLQN